MNTSADEFDKEFYLANLRTMRNCGMAMIPQWKCALLMAILQVWGNNEGFTMSPKFQCDRIFIQETYHINGGETPDGGFVVMLKGFVAKCEAVKDENDPFFQDCAKLIKDRYGFKLCC